MTDPRPSGDGAALDRFVRSLAIDYEKWHDGIGYDVDALRALAPADRGRAESLLVATRDWRDVEALAVLASLGSTSARDALRHAARSGDAEIRMAVLRHAPDVQGDGERTASLVHALEEADHFGGLAATLDQVAEFHPPPVLDALWRGLLARDGDVAVHYAAMLAFLYRKAESTFDWELRPLFLKFATPDADARRAAEAELRALIGAPAAR